MRVGLIGWRGMVGSVLVQRMQQENDFQHMQVTCFSTSNAGGSAPPYASGSPVLQDATDLQQLSTMDVIVSCQGGHYTQQVFQPLRDTGWRGYWIDAASHLRMRDDSTLLLDPVNHDQIAAAINAGQKTFVGCNCTVSLMLMAIGALFQAGLVEWVSAMTYQAASGAGAAALRELLQQMGAMHAAVADGLQNPACHMMQIDQQLRTAMPQSLPTDILSAPLAGSVLPYIDVPVSNGQSKEEWKAMAEANKLLSSQSPIPIDGICVRVAAMRCHSQALTVKLTQDIPLSEIEALIENSHEWLALVPNEREASLQQLTPSAIAGSLKIAVGRLRKMHMGTKYLSVFTVGDQLLWGAAEPLRRCLQHIVKKNMASVHF